MPGSAPLTLIVPNELALLPVVRNFVETACQLAGLDRKAAADMVLAANEATSNVIRHAHQGRPNALVHVQCVICDDGIEVSLFDQGAPFNICEVPNLDPSEIRIGGRGVFLIRALVDELVCTHGDGGGNTLRMVKRRPV
jgi:anti-sigma regulatory factor (Ser/Thr protein kinase)